MKLTEIKINQYRSISNPIRINNLSDFHILVGPNNAGKTNVLNAIEILVDPTGEKMESNEGIEIFGKINFRQENREISYNNQKIQGKLPKDAAKKVIRIGKEPPFEKIATQKLKKFKKLHPENYQSFSSTLENHFQDIQISEELFVKNVKTEEGERPLYRMGEGFKRLFAILFYVYNPIYKLILIDEPELHLHPTVIKKFLKILNNGNASGQIFMTTHHPTLVQAKLLPKVWRISRDKSGSTSAYQLKKGAINIERFVQEINDDNSAMLFADKVLLVEGISDSLLMRGLIDKFYDKGKDIKVVYAGGKGDIDLYEKLCQNYNLPYNLMLDGDALEEYWEKITEESPKLKSSEKKKREILKEKGVFVLKGDLEQNYPKKYQTKDTKPLNALVAGKKIKKEEFQSPQMKKIREIIKNL